MPPVPTHPAYLKPYCDAVRAVGPTFGALLWHSKAYQQVRFKVMTETIRAALAAGHTVQRCPLDARVFVDLGCGCADYALHLRDEGVDYGRYLGVEAVAELARASRDAIATLPDATIIEGDFVAEPVIVDRLAAGGGEVFLLSGSLNTMHESLAMDVLERTWRAVARVRRGVLAFNFLSNRFDEAGPEDCGPARRFHTQQVLAWALARCPRLIFRHDYLGARDATIVLVAEA